MATFHPPEKWVPLQDFLATLDSALAEWEPVKVEADECLSNS